MSSGESDSDVDVPTTAKVKVCAEACCSFISGYHVYNNGLQARETKHPKLTPVLLAATLPGSHVLSPYLCNCSLVGLVGLFAWL